MEIFIKSIVLGIVEGITEFLPISSTGHLIIMNQFVNFTGNFASVFDIVIQLGAILSVLIYFRDRLNPFGAGKTIEQRKDVWSLWQKTFVGVMPAILIGGLVGGKIEELLFNPYIVAIALVIGGVVLIIIERSHKESKFKSVLSMNYGTIIAIGFIQCIAMVPGTSRSAATILGAMALGASRAAAAEFSFFLAIPTMFAASGYTLLKTGLHLSILEWQVLAVGFVISFLVAWAVISLFMSYIRRNDFKPFAYYRIVLGVAVMAYFISNY